MDVVISVAANYPFFKKKIDLIFYRSFKFTHRKIEQKVQRFPIYPMFPHMQSLPMINPPHQHGRFVIIDELTLTCHYHPRFLFYIRIHSWCCTFLVLDKCLMTHIYLYVSTQSDFTVLQTFCATPVHPSSPSSFD